MGRKKHWLLILVNTSRPVKCAPASPKNVDFLACYVLAKYSLSVQAILNTSLVLFNCLELYANNIDVLHRRMYGYNPLESPITSNALIEHVLGQMFRHLPHKLGWNLRLFWASKIAEVARESNRFRLARYNLHFIDLCFDSPTENGSNVSISDSAHTKASLGEIRSAVFYLRLQVTLTPTSGERWRHTLGPDVWLHAFCVPLNQTNFLPSYRGRHYLPINQSKSRLQVHFRKLDVQYYTAGYSVGNVCSWQTNHFMVLHALVISHAPNSKTIWTGSLGLASVILNVQ